MLPCNASPGLGFAMRSRLGLEGTFVLPAPYLNGVHPGHFLKTKGCDSSAGPKEWLD
jgi:hypothetical protein